VLLAELGKEIHENPENLSAVVKQTIFKLKEQFVPVEKAPKYNPNHLIRKAKSTILTKLKRVFELSIKAGIDSPYSYCLEFLTNCRETLDDLENDYCIEQNREKFIKAFEGKLKKSSIQNQEENS
jgi:hypothetical protein